MSCHPSIAVAHPLYTMCPVSARTRADQTYGPSSFMPISATGCAINEQVRRTSTHRNAYFRDPAEVFHSRYLAGIVPSSRSSPGAVPGNSMVPVDDVSISIPLPIASTCQATTNPAEPLSSRPESPFVQSNQISRRGSSPFCGLRN